MTYIITPHNHAFNLGDPAFHIHEFDIPGQKKYSVVEIVGYRWSDEWNEISPRFTGDDQMFKATEFLIELIQAINSNPVVIHCDDFGKIHLIGVNHSD